MTNHLIQGSFQMVGDISGLSQLMQMPRHLRHGEIKKASADLFVGAIKASLVVAAALFIQNTYVSNNLTSSEKTKLFCSEVLNVAKTFSVVQGDQSHQIAVENCHQTVLDHLKNNTQTRQVFTNNTYRRLANEVSNFCKLTAIPDTSFASSIDAKTLDVAAYAARAGKYNKCVLDLLKNEEFAAFNL